MTCCPRRAVPSTVLCAISNFWSDCPWCQVPALVASCPLSASRSVKQFLCSNRHLYSFDGINRDTHVSMSLFEWLLVSNFCCARGDLQFPLSYAFLSAGAIRKFHAFLSNLKMTSSLLLKPSEDVGYPLLALLDLAKLSQLLAQMNPFAISKLW
jgi:hypothetical protein